jgi:hypothetical protein
MAKKKVIILVVIAVVIILVLLFLTMKKPEPVSDVFEEEFLIDEMLEPFVPESYELSEDLDLEPAPEPEFEELEDIE